jgi:hypothetical protein
LGFLKASQVKITNIVIVIQAVIIVFVTGQAPRWKRIPGFNSGVGVSTRNQLGPKLGTKLPNIGPIKSPIIVRTARIETAIKAKRGIPRIFFLGTGYFLPFLLSFISGSSI